MNKQFNDVLKCLVEEALTKSLDDVKPRLMSIKKKIKSEVDVVDEESLRALLQQYCSLTSLSNISLLKFIADELDLTKSKERIDELADEREGFYTSLLAKDYSVKNERMGSHPEVEYNYGYDQACIMLLLLFRLLLMCHGSNLIHSWPIFLISLTKSFQLIVCLYH